MAETLILSDGSVETIFGDADDFLEDLLRRKLGDDTARYFRSMIDDRDDFIAELESECKSQDGTIDFYSALCHEALDNFEVILYELEDTKPDREKLKETAQNGYNALYKNL